MSYITESNILVFLIQIAVLLGLARGLGELFRRKNQPTITAEILVGVVLGVTVLGRLFPQLHGLLFPVEATQQNMLDTFAWIGILFFMLDAGLDTNLATAWRQRGPALILSVSDLIIPMALAFVLVFFLPGRYIGEDGSVLAFALFVGTIMTISALPVTAKIIQELNVYRTDLGLLIMSALTINDVAGWVVFALILGFFTEAAFTVGSVIFVLAATALFAGVGLWLGPRAFDWVLGRMRKLNVPEPAGSLTLVCVTGLIGGAVTTGIGIHALFGFFIGGIVAGESDLIPERTRRIFSEMVHAVLVPVFFASIALRLDFVGDFDFLLVFFIFFVGVFGRYIGAYIGARLIRQLHVHGKFIALAHIPGGQMQIVIGLLALQYGVITDPVYVAIVFGAVLSSMIAGPGMGRILKEVEACDWLSYMPVEGVATELAAGDRDEAIRELCGRAERSIKKIPVEELAAAVLERESQNTTAINNGAAVPHARLAGLKRPVVLLGRSVPGLEWNAPDGEDVHLVFLVFTPRDDPESQLQILRGIAMALAYEDTGRRLISESLTADGMLAILRRVVNETTPCRIQPRGKRKGNPGAAGIGGKGPETDENPEK